MDATAQRILEEKKQEIYREFNITKDNIEDFGRPEEILQAFDAYFKDDGTKNSPIYPRWSTDKKNRLRMMFALRSLSGKFDIYNIPIAYKIIDYQEEPYLVDFSKRPKGKTIQDDLNELREGREPLHQEILIQLWSENNLLRYTTTGKKMNKLRNTYKMGRKYVKSPITPWYVSDTIPEDVMIEYHELRKKKMCGKINALDFTRGLCQALYEKCKKG